MTTTFNIYPAIDLRQGQVVRLKYGDLAQQTVFGDDPAAMGERWVAAGCRWLHVVNLDGAFDEAGAANWQVLPQLTQLGVPVQFGGGIRTLADVARAVAAGVSRVILGTAAIETPDLVAEAVARFGSDRVAVGIDARDGLVKTRGWVGETAVTPTALGQHMYALGVRTAIYTDISRDGVLTGVNAAATAQLAQETKLQVIASGGVASLADVEQCRALSHQGVTGLIIGRALYDGRVQLAEAIKIAAEDLA